MRKSFFAMLALLTCAAGIGAQEPNDNVLHLTFAGAGAPIESEHTLLGSRITFSEDGRQMNFTTNGATATYDISQVSGMSYSYGTPAVALTAHEDPQHAGDYYTTFYSGLEAYAIPAGVTAYTASLETYNAETYLILGEITDNILPQGEAVLLKSTGTDISMETTAPVPASGANMLSGVDVATVTTAIPGTVYTLSGEDGLMAFYRYVGETMPANKAYLGLPAGTPAPRRIGFGSQVATEIENTNAAAEVEKLLLDGKVLIRKNGHLYNMQGAVVE